MSHAVGEIFRPAFEDRNVPDISYGLPFPEACSKHVEESFGASRVYIIASKSLTANTNTLKRLEDALGPKVVGTRVGMRPHTPWSDIVSIVNEARPLDADCIITLGAGSLTDGAKIIAWALANDVGSEEDLSLLWAQGPTRANSPQASKEPNPPVIPVISVPTSLSGGEYQSIAGGTYDKTNEKRLFQPPTKNPAIVVLDPELTTTTPEWVWLSTGVRSVDHCIETLCSLLSTPQGDTAARSGLRALIPALLRCKHDPEDLEARLQCQMGVIDAMSAVSSGVPLGASHAIGHQLGPLGVGHGVTSCLMLPAVCKWNAAQGANNARQQACIDILMEDPEIRRLMSARKNADLGDILDAVIRELGMPRTLKEVGIGRDKLDLLADNSLRDHWIKTNAQPITEKSQVMEILEMVLE